MPTAILQSDLRSGVLQRLATRPVIPEQRLYATYHADADRSRDSNHPRNHPPDTVREYRSSRGKAFGAAWAHAIVDRKSVNPLAMLWQVAGRNAAFVAAARGKPPGTTRRPVVIIAAA